MKLTIPKITIPPAKAIANEPAKKLVIPLNGKLITAEDPLSIGKNFRSLINMRYGDSNPESIAGMTKINTSILDSTYFKARNAFHFNKPSETHILAQAYNTGLTASKVYENKAAPPAAGDFETTALWTDTAGAGVGRFSEAPNGCVAYCNGVDTCLWAGDEDDAAAFINFDPNGSFLYDYTNKVENTLDDSENIALLYTVGNGIDAATGLMLALDNNVTDTSPTTAHTVTNNNVTFSTTEKAFGTHGAVFNGTNAYLSVALATPGTADADFDATDGTLTVDLRAKFTNFTGYNVLYYQKTDLTKISFDTGAHAPVAGEIIHGNTSTATGIVDYVDVSGGWAGAGTGTIYMHTVTGTWQNAEVIHDPSNNAVANTTSTASDAGDNYIKIFTNPGGTLSIVVYECYGAGSAVVSVTSGFALTAGVRYHLEFVENGNSWYIFVDGQLKQTGTDASRAKAYISPVLIGYDDAAFLVGSIDEYRVSTSARHTANFTPPAAAYSTATNVAHVYVASIRPLKGIKPYVKVANASAAAVTGVTWGASGWTALTITADNTATGGATLAKTGTITFTSTVDTSKLKYIEGRLLYFYWFSFTGIDATTSLYHCTVDAPFQKILDYWDGVERTVDACFKYTTTYEDTTLNVYQDSYDTADATSYMNLSSMSAYSSPNNCVILGFFEKMAVFNIGVPSDRTNSTAATIMSIDYWNGSSFATVGAITDGTSEGGISLAKSGMVSFTPPTAVFESTVSNNSTPLYYYRIRWDQAMDASVGIYYVAGIPDQIKIRGYKFPLYSQDRLMLCNNMDGKRNSVKISSQDTSQVLNGSDSMEFEFGGTEELTAGCSIFAMYGNSLYTISLVFKDQEQWGLVNTGTEWRRYQISDKGCAAPLTLDTVTVPSTSETQQNQNRGFAIWATSDGVYISDGRHPVNVSNEIRDLFDQKSTIHVNLDAIKSWSGKVNKSKMEYSLKLALNSATILDYEIVLDLRRWKWYAVDRTHDLQCSVDVTDAYGNFHHYGFIEDGYMERLDYGNTFDGHNIVSTLYLGDFPLNEGDFLIETSIDSAILVMTTSTTNDPTVTHYIDTATSGTDYTIDASNTDKRLAFPVTIINSIPGIMHSFKMVVTSNDAACAFKPLMLIVWYHDIRNLDYV
jgi:hypothetical protein